jgi:hypothetical protein
MRFLLAVVVFVAACSGPSAPPVEPTSSAAAVPVEQAVPQDAVAATPDAAPLATPDAPQTADHGATGLGDDNAACKTGADCASGICEGEGCTDDKLGHCAPAKRGCTRDRREYCGCDGHIFFGSGSCPKQRYASRGKCQP